MIKDLLLLMLFILVIVVLLSTLYFIIGCLRLIPDKVTDTRVLMILSKRTLRSIRRAQWWHDIKCKKFVVLIDFVKWVVIDVLRGREYFELFGIWAFTGYYGQGKSMGTVLFAKKLIDEARRRNIHMHLASNYYIAGQDFRVYSWQDILKLPDNTILVFDEIQSTFSSNKYKDFPIDLLWRLTQSRKRRLTIFCTTPVYRRMSIQLRESVDYAVECKNVGKMHRWFRFDFYRASDYEKIAESNSILLPALKRSLRDRRRSFIASDEDYKSYDTTMEIDRWDIEDDNTAKTKVKGITKRDFTKLRDEIIKRIEEVERKIK